MPLDFKNITIPLVRGVDNSDNILNDPSATTAVVDGRVTDEGRAITRTEVFTTDVTFTGNGNSLARLSCVDGEPLLERAPASSQSHSIKSRSGEALTGNRGFPYAIRMGVDDTLELGSADHYDVAQNSYYTCVATVTNGAVTVHMIDRSSGRILWRQEVGTSSLGRLRVVESGNGTFHLFVFTTATVDHYPFTGSTKPSSSSSFSTATYTDVAFDAVASETGGACNVFVHYTSAGIRYLASLRVSSGAFTTRATSVVSSYARVSNITVARCTYSGTKYDLVLFAELSGAGTPPPQRIVGVLVSESVGTVSAVSVIESNNPASTLYGYGQIIAQSHKVDSRWSMRNSAAVYIAVTMYNNASSTVSAATPLANISAAGVETTHLSYTRLLAVDVTSSAVTANAAYTNNMPTLYGVAAHSSPVVDKTTLDLFLPVHAITSQTPTLHLIKVNNSHAGYFVAASLHVEEFGSSNVVFPFKSSLLGAGRCMPSSIAEEGVLTVLSSKQGLEDIGGTNVLAGTPTLYATGSTTPVASLFRLSETSSLGDVQADGTSTMAGAQPLCKNSTTLMESGIHHPPLMTGVTVYASPTSYMLAGTYRVCTTWSYTDASGRVLESSPSVPVSITIPTNYYSYLVAPVEPLTHGSLKLNVYRTAAGGSTFYLDAMVQADPYSYGGGFYGIADADLVYRPQLYTQSQARNAPPPPSHSVCEHQNRLFCTDGRSIRYTKEITPGYAARWLPSTDRIDVPPTFGRAVALVSMNEQLMVFCEKAIGVVRGEGPSLLGADGSYSALTDVLVRQRIPWGHTNAVIRSKYGVWFWNGNGIRLLTDQLALARDDSGDLGSSVDATFSSASISATHATYFEGEESVLFQAGGLVVVCDEATGMFTTMAHGGGTTARGMALEFPVAGLDNYNLFVGTKDVLQKQASGTFSVVSGGEDPVLESYSSLVVETGWINLGVFDGFQRVTHLTLTGEQQGAHTENVTVEVAYGYDGSRGATADESGWTTISTAQPMSPEASANYTGYSWRTVRHEFHLPVQKCNAIKFRVTVVPGDFDQYSTFRLTALTIRVGVKNGRSRPTKRA